VRDGIIRDSGGVSIVGRANVDGKKGIEGVKTQNIDDGGVKFLVGEVWRRRGWPQTWGRKGEVCRWWRSRGRLMRGRQYW